MRQSDSVRDIRVTAGSDGWPARPGTGSRRSGRYAHRGYAGKSCRILPYGSDIRLVAPDGQ
jgi:hypothetical protein